MRGQQQSTTDSENIVLLINIDNNSLKKAFDGSHWINTSQSAILLM